MKLKMNNSFNSIRLSLIILFLFNLTLSACEDEVFDITNSEKFILPALRERLGLNFRNNTRDLYTIISDSSSFNTIYPGTDKSCGYIIRYYFYTNIFLGENQSTLISMNRSKFNISSENNVIDQTNSVIDRIKNMSFGNKEYQELIINYPNLK